MNKEELLQQITNLNNKLFSLDMIDHWDNDIKEEYNKLYEEKLKLYEELEKIENESRNMEAN